MRRTLEGGIEREREMEVGNYRQLVRNGRGKRGSSKSKNEKKGWKEVLDSG